MFSAAVVRRHLDDGAAELIRQLDGLHTPRRLEVRAGWVQDLLLAREAREPCRIGAALQHVGEALTSDAEGFDEAYVGPWDVANFVSDVLMARTSGDDDRCACSSSPSAAALDERAAALS